MRGPNPTEPEEFTNNYSKTCKKKDDTCYFKTRSRKIDFVTLPSVTLIPRE
jgi:hypothetical protein